MSHLFEPVVPASSRSRRGPARIVVPFVVAVSMLAAACSGGGASVQAGKAVEGDTPSSPTVRDVLPDPSLELSDETVVVRSDGGRAVKEVPDDAGSIVIDAGAEGADELDPGDIMLLTGVTVVRVAALDKEGDELRITGAPVSLPEVIRNGELSWDAEPVDLSAARLNVWDGDEAEGEPSGSPGSGAVPGGSSEGIPTEEEIEDLWGDVNDVFGGGDGGDLFGLGPDDLGLISSLEEQAVGETPAATPKLERSVKVKVKGVEYSLTYTRDDKGHADVFKLSIESGSGKDAKSESATGKEIDVAEAKVKGSIDTEVQLKDMNHSGKMKVVDGEVRNFELAVPRVAGEINVDAKFQALSMVAHMTSDPLFDLPLSLEFPVLVGGVPFTFDVKVGVQVNLSMAKLDNTLNGQAKVTFDGDAGFKYAGGQFSVFGKRVQNVEDLLKTVQGVADGPVGLVFTNELPKLGFGLGLKGIKAGVFLSNGYVVSFHILPMPAPCTATNVSYVLASGVTGDFFGLELEIARKAITEKQWHFQLPQDQRCNGA